MGSSDIQPIRSLPRAFVPGLSDPLVDPFDLPKEEQNKFKKVLRLVDGDLVAVLPGDGRLVRCELTGDQCRPLDTVWPQTESRLRLTVALGLSRPDSLEESIRMATEIGAAGFVVFPADRSVVRWDKVLATKKFERLSNIIREAAEVCFRTSLPKIEWRDSLKSVLTDWPEAVVFSEVEGLGSFELALGLENATIVIGPEGGWSPREVSLIGERAVSLGPRVLRVDTAVASACARMLCS